MTERSPRADSAAMLLYLVRHAHAVKEEENPSRPLSSRGRDEAQRIAAFFRTNGALAAAQIWHSPLVRARETAELLAAGLGLEGTLVETSDLLPDDDPTLVQERLSAFPETRALALVGHEPHLGALTTLLLRGKSHPVLVEIKKGAVLAFERTSDVHRRSGQIRWRLQWMVTPALLPRLAPGLLPSAP